MTEAAAVRLTRDIAYPSALVWKALTTPSIMAAWWAEGDIRPEVGHAFALDMGAFGRQSCEVIAVQPERLLAYIFGAGTLNTTVTWRLEPADGGTRLSLEHSGFDLDTEMGQQAYRGMAGGWPVVLDRLDAALANLSKQ